MTRVGLGSVVEEDLLTYQKTDPSGEGGQKRSSQDCVVGHENNYPTNPVQGGDEVWEIVERSSGVSFTV